uniref:restriction endonuclease subunit S n=1 Tax=Roseivirga sp. TaxID=1964215 RepID=UPI00404792FD
MKKTIGELCLIEKGKIGIQKATPGEFPLVVTAEERLSHNEYHFEGNAVVIPLVSSTGHGHRSLKRIHFQSGKFAVGNILGVVIPKDENTLRADYLYRFLDLNREKELVGRMRGMANVSLPIKEIAKIEIPVPPIDAQIEFVQQYSNLEGKSNELGGELTHQLDLVKQLRQSFLREAIQGKLVPQDENDEPASVLLEKIKAEKERLIKERKIKKQKPLQPVSDDEIPFEIPENWVWCRLGEITSLVTDGKHGDCRNQKESGYYFLSAKDLQLNKFVYEGAREITYDDFQETHNRTDLEPGDLCVVNTGATIGKTVIAPESPLTRKTTFQKSVAVVKFFNSFTSVFFMEYLVILQTPTLLKTSRGSAINNLLLGDMRNMAIPLPPFSEQQRIVAKLDELMRYCDELEASIKESQQQNELLLQQVLREALKPSYAKASDGKPKPTVVSEGNQKEMGIERV